MPEFITHNLFFGLQQQGGHDRYLSSNIRFRATRWGMDRGK
jgi:hypothetical protein